MTTQLLHMTVLFNLALINDCCSIVLCELLSFAHNFLGVFVKSLSHWHHRPQHLLLARVLVHRDSLQRCVLRLTVEHDHTSLHLSNLKSVTKLLATIISLAITWNRQVLLITLIFLNPTNDDCFSISPGPSCLGARTSPEGSSIRFLFITFLALHSSKLKSKTISKRYLRLHSSGVRALVL